ncbi:MAG TPA: mannose-1-phosphate guanylyltransferase/mannose-6-phosphate isomerase [Desulfatirhabdiaceae bacterium]|nr:mannose-1-phosphate guanylyltransferase/mannose-6-phosphate isomerase [Desulfatirhabdiaceae bacterium]
MTDTSLSACPVILAGGSGTRLWPVSRELHPKQLVKFIGEDSLIQSTIKRLVPVMDIQNVRVVCGKEHEHDIRRHLEQIGIHSPNHIIAEPCGRNTAPAVLVAIFSILQQHPDAVLCVFPADHVIRDQKAFHDRLRDAIRLAQAGYIVTFGIRPDYPETGYGYIEGAEPVSDGARRIRRFVEKPDVMTARQYVDAGNFFWNSGMFAFRASVMLTEFHEFAPEMTRQVDTMLKQSASLDRETYAALPNMALDVAIMEKTRKGVVLPSEFGWSDIGSWKSLYDFLPKDSDNNVFHGDVIAQNTRDCFVMGHDRLIAVNHISNMVIVETPDSIFVSDMETSRDVKGIVSTLKANNRWEYQQHTTASRPWGSFTVLETRDRYRVGKMMVYPGSSTKVKTRSDSIKILNVVDGRADIRSGEAHQVLNPGESFRMAENTRLELLNPTQDMLTLIQVRTRREEQKL